MNGAIEEIFEFWFGGFPDAYSADQTRREMWFDAGHCYDQEIFIKFGSLYQLAIEGELDHWQHMPRGRLVLIVLLDQFSRHIHRGYAQAFAQDEKAQTLCVEGIAAGDDYNLHPVERHFFYLPLGHAENLQRQKLGVQAFNQLLAEVPETHQQPFREALEWTMKQHCVIEDFGRFPDLNEVLGRESKAEELDFLDKKEQGFL